MASSTSKSAKTSKKSEKTPIIAVYQEKPDLRKKEPPLVDLQVSNPLTYLKSWWKRVMGREGIDFRFRIHPITAIVIAVILATFSFGVGRIVLYPYKPFFEFVPPATPTPTPIPNPWRETAFSGALRFSGLNQKYYLITSTSEAINLEVPENVDLSGLIGTRIFATGRFNEKTRTLVVVEATDLEILPPEVEPVPIVSPEPTLEPEPAAEQIRVTSPLANQAITSPFLIEGEALGTWYFEGDFPIKLLDGEGNLISTTFAVAQGEWMTEEFVPFQATLEFSQPTTAQGTLILEKDNPSGLPENAEQLEIPVTF